MKKELIEKIIRNGSADTKTYRYIYKDCGDHAEIQRLPLSDLNTTAAINGWKTVKIFK